MLTMSTKTQTDSKIFEKNVGDLLRAVGYDVKDETLISHKKVDLYLEERRFGGTHRIAVECKLYDGVLSQSDISEIIASYQPLYQNNFVDDILIISMKGLSPAAQRLVLDTRNFRHLTFAELQNSIMDFHSYLLGLIHDFKSDALANYYIPVNSKADRPVEDHVFEWLNVISERPLAILGSYGSGKTSFARCLAHTLAIRALENPMHRIPIFLRLGEISSEQSLEGLLGKAFTATSLIKNYSFHAFMKLNADGRLIIILDGFDEMKHCLSWEEFRFNFRQLHRLVVGNSSVILLGRPTAFLSDAEYKFALHGIKSFAGQEIRDVDCPDYIEIHLSLFNRDQVEDFLLKYFTYKETTAKDDNQKRIFKRIRSAGFNHISGKQLADIARRPVQLKMLAEILPQWRGDISFLTTSILYSEFIDLIIDRELKKNSRLLFKHKERRRFAREIAWFLWTTKREMSITAEDIPDAILNTYLSGTDDLDAVRRDLIAACFLGRKLGESLYFPHRSFQEFLVAEEIINKLISREISFSEADALLNEEVVNFLIGLVNVKVFQKFEPSFNQYRGHLSSLFIRMWLSDDKYSLYCTTHMKDTSVPWYPLILSIGIKQDKFTMSMVEGRSLLLNGISSDLDYSFLCFLCIIYLYDKTAKKDIVSALLRFKNLLSGVLTEHQRKTINDFLSRISFVKKKGFLDISGVYSFLFSRLDPYCLVQEWRVGSTLCIKDLGLPTKISGFSNDIENILDLSK